MAKEITVFPKFSTVFVSDSFSVPDELKVLKQWCALFEEKGLAPSHSSGTFGNLSLRISGSDEFIITASSVGLKNKLADDDFVLVKDVDITLKKIIAEGKKQPSSESMLHWAVYKKREDINAVFHGHCREILCKSKRLGISETKEENDYGSPELVNSVLEVLGNDNFIIMKNHGFLSLGKTMDEAGNIALKVLADCL